MKRGKRIKPVFPIEYHLLITSLFKETIKQKVTSFKLRTTSEFSNFSYEIIVEPEISNRTIKLNIRGIRAPQLSIPSSGPAVYTLESPDLSGRYKLIVSKSGKEDNVFFINITKKKIIIEKCINKKFIDVTTSTEEW